MEPHEPSRPVRNAHTAGGKERVGPVGGDRRTSTEEATLAAEMPPERRLSSGATGFYKRVFPVVWFGILGVMLVVGVVSGFAKHGYPDPTLLVLPVMVAIGYYIMKLLIFGVADEVWDDGDALLVRRGRRFERVELFNIINVSSSTISNPNRITLTLREPGRFGREISFLPPLRMLPSTSTHPVARELIDRVEAARRGAYSGGGRGS
jgi:hypothetical protein